MAGLAKIAAAGLVLGLLALLPARALAQTPCAQLVGAQFGHATVTAAVLAPAGQVTACKIDATSRPTPDSDIRIEVWIPQDAAWNGRYLQLGNGGFAGAIASQRLAVYAAQGYAVAMTDDGHEAMGTDGRWAIGHPQKVIDFGWRALKETTDTAKALIRANRGSGPKFSYFNGCSDGGREALMEAQRFPDDFNGIVAGAPAYNFSGLLTLGAYYMQTLGRPDAYLTADKLKALETAALAQCGGGAYVADPLACHFDPASIACPAGADQPNCLTGPQVAAARDLYRGLVAPDGRVIYPGYSPGGEAERGGWSAWVAGPSLGEMNTALIYNFATGFWGGFVYGAPNFNVMTFDLARAHADGAQAAAIVNSTDPNLAPFRAHGGKLIQYHGWNDPAIPARGSIVYYENVRASLGDTDNFYRLYMIPGMLHCGGGPGPSVVDWQALVQAWVEDGQPPREVAAQTRGAGGALSGPTQTLRPYSPGAPR